jgi:hypothetical protein
MGHRYGGRGERCRGVVAVVRGGPVGFVLPWIGVGQRIVVCPGVSEVFGYPEFFELPVVSGISGISAPLVVLELNFARPGFFPDPEIFEDPSVVVESSVVPEPVRPFAGAVVVVFHRGEDAELKIGCGKGLIAGRRTVRRV